MPQPPSPDDVTGLPVQMVPEDGSCLKKTIWEPPIVNVIVKEGSCLKPQVSGVLLNKRSTNWRVIVRVIVALLKEKSFF